MTTLKYNRNYKQDHNNSNNSNNHAGSTAGDAILEVIDDDTVSTTMSPITTTMPYSVSLSYASPVTSDPDLKHHQIYGSSKKRNTTSQDTGISYNPVYYGAENSINISSTDHTILNHILSLIAVGESPPEVKVFTKPSRDGMQGAFSTHVEVHQRLPSSSHSFSRSKRNAFFASRSRSGFRSRS